MTKRLGLLVAGATLLWVLLFTLACIVWPDQIEGSLVSSLTALALCLIPTVLTYLWSAWGLKQGPDMQLITVLGGTGVRMFFVLGVGLLLSLSAGFLREHQLTFWMWVLIFYLATLALEMALIVKAQVATEKAPEAGTPTSS